MSDKPKLVKKQPSFIYANTHSEFLKKNKLESCNPIKDMYHQCMSDTNQKFHVCDYIYSMMFVCSTLEFQDSSRN